MEMKNLREAIIATISYYDIFDYPLTLLEVKQYLVNPQRLFPRAKPLGKIPLGIILQILENLNQEEIIGQKNGFYFIRARDDLYEIRIEREKISAQKWKKLLCHGRWLATVPYLQGIFVSGSLSINNATEDSDFDVLIIIRDGRLYLARIFLSLVTSLFDVRRTRYEKLAPDKFCFNHYVTSKHLDISYESLFNAQTYSALKPVFMSRNLFNKFYISNVWINKYVYNFKPSFDITDRRIKISGFLTGAAALMEKIFNGLIGQWLENLSKRYQQKRIANNPMTYQSGGRVVFNDYELEFHPRSFERTVIEKYNYSISDRLGSLVAKEHDSGLGVDIKNRK